MKSKKITKSGAISIPKTMRLETGMHPGVGVDVEQNGDTITIKPHVPTCRFCGGVERVKSVMDIEICTDCAAKIHEAVLSDD